MPAMYNERHLLLDQHNTVTVYLECTIIFPCFLKIMSVPDNGI